MDEGINTLLLFWGTNISSADPNLQPGIELYHNRGVLYCPAVCMSGEDFDVSRGGRKCSWCRLRRRHTACCVITDCGRPSCMSVDKVNKLLLNLILL
jgi:hypothetical protein